MTPCKRSEDIAKKLIIKTGVNTGKHPSVSAVYRAPADAADLAAQGCQAAAAQARREHCRFVVGVSGPAEGLLAMTAAP